MTEHRESITPWSEAQPLEPDQQSQWNQAASSGAQLRVTKPDAGTRLPQPVSPRKQSSHDSSSTSDPYMHLVDDLLDKGSDYSYKGTEDDERSSSSGAELSGTAMRAGSPDTESPEQQYYILPEAGEPGHGEAKNRSRMDRMDSAHAHKGTQRRRGFAAWRQARKNRKEKAAAAAAALLGAALAAPAEREPELTIYAAFAAAPTSPFDAGVQVGSSRSSSLQPLNTRLDSAVDYIESNSLARVTRAQLQLNALPTILSPRRSDEQQQAAAGGSPSLGHRLESVFEAAATPETVAGAATPRQPAEQLNRADSYDQVCRTPQSGQSSPILVLATLCQSVQSLVQMPFVGVVLLEDASMSCLLRFSFGGEDSAKSPSDAAFTASLVEPHTLDTVIVEDTLKQPGLKDSPAVCEPPGIRFYVGVPLTISTGLRLGFLYIADQQPQRFDAELVPPLQNFAKAIAKKLEKMGAAGRVLERRAAVLRSVQSQQEPFLVVDTATPNWQMLHASAAAQEAVLSLTESLLLRRGLWDLFFAAAPNQDEENFTAGVPTGLGGYIMHSKEFSLDVRQRHSESPTDFTLHFRPAPGRSEGSDIQPVYIVGVQAGRRQEKPASPKKPERAAAGGGTQKLL